jgi:ATPase subunit of ABC transporter with duplicated ATPase domains
MPVGGRLASIGDLPHSEICCCAVDLACQSRTCRCPLMLDGVPTRSADARAVELLQRVGLGDWARHRPGEDVFTAIMTTGTSRSGTRAQLDRLGLGHITFDRRLGSLSGGEVVSLGWTAQLLKRPDVPLLNEPTNNLDLVSVGQLEAALNAYEGAFVVVSHDVRFLAQIGVQRRLRLSDGRLASA